jgi:hypothetical protein
MRYVMANRSAGSTETQTSSRAAVTSALGVLDNSRIINDSGDRLPRRIVVFEAEPGQIEAKSSSFHQM